MAKKYYWLKLKNDFFKQKEIKKLRKIAGGDTYVIIYLKMQLLSLQEEGRLIFEGFEDDICEELALELDEETDNVKVTFMYLLKYGLIQEVQEDEFLISKVPSLIGSETNSAERVRRHREKKKLESAQETILLPNTEPDKKEDEKPEADKKPEEAPKKKPRKTTEKVKKNKYGEYNHVSLTDTEYNRLVSEYGQAKTNKCITFLDEYIEEKGYASKSHNLAIRRWVKDAVDEKENKSRKTSNTGNSKGGNVFKEMLEDGQNDDGVVYDAFGFPIE